MEEQAVYLGVDLGGTDIKAVVLEPDGRILWSRRIGTNAKSWRGAVLDRLIGIMAEAVRETAAPVRAAGIAVPGVLDLATGTVELMTNFTPEWNGFGLQAALEARTGLPVFLLNDVRAATVAEQMWGAGKGYRNFLCLAIGTGIGGGLVINGELYMGSRGAAGEIGHQTMVPDGPRCSCGNCGCLEAVASGPAIARAARDAIQAGDQELAAAVGNRVSTECPTPEQIADAARRGNPTARAIFAEAGEHIGRALGNLVCVLNPEAVVVGGGVVQAGELLLEPIRAEIERRTVVFSRERGGVALHQSPFGAQAGAIGAAAWAMSRQEPAQTTYIKEVQRIVDRIAEEQAGAIAETARVCADAILRIGLVHLFGSGHSRMAVEEMYPRYGSFPGFHPMVEQSLSNHHQVVGSNGQRQAMFIENAQGLGKVIMSNFRFDPERDVMIVISAGGTNAVPVEVALEAKRLGMTVIAITSVEHSRLSKPRHSTGRRLFEIADLVIDLCTPPGDAAVRVEGLDTPVGPLTSIASLTIINMIKTAIAQRLAAAGKPPTVLTSAVLVGEERSHELFERSYQEYRDRTRRL